MKLAESFEEQFEHFLGEDGGEIGKVLDSHAGELSELVATTSAATEAQPCSIS